ncbi:DUF167 domain-containing protein [Sulfurihydrogenibium yellowstonense]|uniref:UPF0235 protein SULYE_0762 n=1 Tax=Sulfurihydrogenibium yellowstonense SS-5 TaxID=432331 RepID=C4FJL3_9AQUI|nr:DUF167 domain-containing protein [Sulfurihydrogenibium yellowstonense]EEP60739.1 conserved domain protein [Sulfurihydrogenibium yellowstonense SS-5]
MRIKVKVKPGASENEVKKIDEYLYEVRTTTIPEKGKANEKVIELLSDFFDVPKSKIKIIKGQASREKEVEVVE